MRPHVDPDPELLLAHSVWIRGLARRLASGAEAEDLVQDTWLAVLERPRAEVRSLRSWLAGLVSNLAREKRRAEARRRIREARAAGGASAGPSVAETFEAAATGRELADIVLALEEPFRSVVLLRYYEDLPPRRIARVLGVPVRTVNSRLTRGLERLRERWKQRERAAGGDGDGWVRSLLFLAGARTEVAVPAATCASGAALSLGVVLMNAKIWLAAVVVGAGTMAWWLSAPREAHPRATGEEVASSSGRETLAPVPEEGVIPSVRREERRTEVVKPEVPASTGAPATPAGALRILRGRVLDTDALPLAGVEVVLADWSSAATWNGRPKAISGPNGVFELETPPEESGMLRASDDDYVTVMSGRIDGRSAVEPLVVVARRIELAGTVVDETGAPLTEVRVSSQLPPGFRARFEAVLDTTDAGEWRSVTDESGRFELVPVPSIEGAELVAELEGFGTWRSALPWQSERALVLTLVRAAPKTATLSGVVLDPDGRPAAGAWVSLGARSTATDSAGEFRLERSCDALDATELRALKGGHRLARFAAEVGPDGKPAWPEYVVLELGGPPLELAGRVLDAQGAPRTDVRVWIADATPFGVLMDDMLASAEYYLAGTEDGYFSSCEADAEGRFRLAGLLERDYSVSVMSLRTLASRTFGPFHAGDRALELVLDEGPLGRIEGRVVARDGRGLGDVSVSLTGNGFGGIWWSAGSVLSDDDGKFTFANVGGTNMKLAASGDDVVPIWSPVEAPDGKTIEVELPVAVRCHFKVDLGADAERADALRVLDGEENPLVVYRIDPNGTLILDEFPIVAGRSDSLGVDERAATLVLLKNGVEVLRVPVDLRPGSLNLITP